MEKRRFGRTNHMSTVAIFGAASLGDVSQAEAEKAFEQVLSAGVNHIDVAPSYGHAEALLGPMLPAVRDRFFLGCKTTERTRDGAAAELRASLKRLQVDRFDLYQFHAVTSMEELDQVFAPGGALEAVLAAKEEGLLQYIGITGHGLQVAEVFLEALNRFDFDSVLFPVNFVLYGDANYRSKAEELLQACRDKNVGVMAIKAVAKKPWGDQKHFADTWYTPFDSPEMIQQAVNFSLSQDVTGLCTAGDVKILPLFLEACEHFTPMRGEQQAEMLNRAKEFEPIFP
ncbi:MAG: aldo/keto reductase [Omnitrophica WOR_2 bacterium]